MNKKILLRKALRRAFIAFCVTSFAVGIYTHFTYAFMLGFVFLMLYIQSDIELMILEIKQ